MNFNKIGRKFLLGLVSLVVVLSCVKLGASAEGTTGILYLNDTSIAEREKVDGNYEVPTKDGYVFGGWYSDDKGQYPLDEEQANKATTAYAKWVPDYVLSVKAQVNQNALNDDFTGSNRAAIRLLTSVDSRDYKSVGFDVVRGDYPSYTYHLDSKNVYESLRVVGEAEGSYTEHTPEGVFGSDSHFFEAVTFKNMPEGAVNTELTATPYWVTLDGTRVEGTKSIKTVNLGRSWVYIDSNANADGEEYGTCGHPFTKLDSALDAVSWVDGKITVKGTSTFEVPGGTKELNYADGFKWNQEKIKVNGSVRNITVTGENGTNSFISFDTVPDMGINDNVTFENIKLQFATQVYANGNKFIIADDVILNNADTNLYGGASKASVESTNLNIHAGTWAAIYGGGRYSGGDVSKDTNIYITNAKIFSDTKDSCMIVGGGRGANTVGGNTNITVGEGFNTNISVEDGHYSAIYGGGRESGSVVTGNTNVTIKGGAKVNFVYGGGASNTTVKGTCNVTLLDGEVYSIWGGARGEDPSSAGKNEKDTVVKVAGGTVAQIIGGNGTGMTDNTYVEVSGGKVTRRIHGGCYNDILSLSPTTYHVTGYSTVVIKDMQAVENLSSGLDTGITAGSRCYEEQTDEIGILICNNGSYTSLENKISTSFNEYDYLVKATSGGTVTTSTNVIENEALLSIKPTSETTPGKITENNAVTYFKGEGVCALPTRDDLATQCTVEVNFSPSDAQAGLDSCEARIDGMYYSILEDAVAFALKRSDKPAVTLCNDAEIESSIVVESSTELTIQNEDADAYTIKGVNATNDVFSVEGKLKIKNLKLEGGKRGVYVLGGELIANDITIDNVGSKGMQVNKSVADITNLTVTNAGEQEVQFEWNSDVTISGFTLSDSVNTENATFYVTDGATVKAENGNINDTPKYAVYVKDATVILDNVSIDDANYGVYAEKDSVVTLNQVEIKNTANEGVKNLGGNVNFNGGSITAAKGCGIWNTSAGQTTANNVTIDTITKYGVYVEKSTTVNLDNVTVSNVNGGNTERSGIQCAGTLNITANNSQNKGVQISTVTNGHGIYSTADGKVIAQGIRIDNTSKTGVTFNGNTNVTGLSISNTKTQGMQFAGACTATVTDFEVLNANTAGTTSAVVYSAGTSRVKLVDGTILAGKNGIYLDGTSVTEATDVKVNRVSGNDNALVFVKSGTIFTLNEENGTSTINGKPSEEGTYVGRGIEVEGTFNLDGGTICNNEITSDIGAGVLVKAGGTFNMNGGSVSNNKAPNGGGVSVSGQNAIFILEGGNISSNTATTNGGGVAVLASGKFTMKNGTISTNTAPNGGGVSVEGLAATDETEAVLATFNFDNGTIFDNAATNGGGVALLVNAEFNMKGGNITQNTVTTSSSTSAYGAGVYVCGENATFNMSAGTISANIMTGKTYGSGVSLNGTNSKFTMTGGVISENNAANAGGAVAVNGTGATFILNGGTLKKNSSNNGGAVYAASGMFEMQSGTISENTTISNGAAIWATGSISFTMKGGNITGNIAANQGGAIYLNTATCIVVLEKGMISGNTATKNAASNGIRGNKATNITKYATFVLDDATHNITFIEGTE